MGSVLWSVMGFIVAIGILVSFHEYGHFFVARCFGVKVQRFSIGFGKPLWKRIGKKGTEFVIAAIPLGGYVRMADENEGVVAPADLPFTFNRKSVWARMLIVLAGPFFNFIFAFFAFWLIFLIGTTVTLPVLGPVHPNSIAGKAGLNQGDEIIAVKGTKVLDWRDVNMALLPELGGHGSLRIEYKKAGNPDSYGTTLDLKNWKVDQQSPDLLASLGFTRYLPPIPANIAMVLPDSPAEHAGLKPGDKVVMLGGASIQMWEQMTAIVDESTGKSLSVQILRDGKILNLTLTPVMEKAADGTTQGRIGIQSAAVHWPRSMQRTIRYSVRVSAWKGVSQTWKMCVLTAQMLYKMVLGQISVRSISGPIGIAQIAGATAQMGFTSYLSFLALVSISLGIINLLPIPVLDGGHFLYFVIEAIRGKPLSDRVQLWGMKAGMILLLALMLFAVLNDLTRVIN